MVIDVMKSADILRLDTAACTMARYNFIEQNNKL